MLNISDIERMGFKISLCSMDLREVQNWQIVMFFVKAFLFELGLDCDLAYLLCSVCVNEIISSIFCVPTSELFQDP